ncbi:hypothetical protein LguiB_031570 [Lonicera macranthoides]
MSSCSSSTTTSTAHGRATPITAVHHDIIEAHILTRLDAPTLASAASVSRTLHALCSEEKLWRDICNSTWTSTSDPRVRHAISAFPNGYRSFFFDSTPATFHRANTLPPDQHPQSVTTQLISAIDLHYEKEPIFSKVEVTETVSKDFMGPPLLVQLFNRKETAPAPVQFDCFNDDFLSHLQQSMKLSWIMIDPTQKRAVNLSSLKPVSVQRHYMADEAQLLYVTILPGSRRVGSSEFVECRIVVTCGGEEGGEVHAKEVSMNMQDMDGVILSGEDSLVILQQAMGSERRKEGKGRERYEEFMEMKREKRGRKQTREKRLDLVCMILRVMIFVTLLWAFLLSLGSV